jgi:phosphatidylethanolamine/phosphatidyl-N-methylethanolamine N-methyltransferase
MARTTSAERLAIESRRVQRVYSVLARVYDGAFDWALGPGRRAAVSRLRAGPDDKVLEVGVGTGLSMPFYPPGCRLTGIDITEAMLAQARGRADSLSRPEVQLRLMDARSLEFPDGCFDRVLAPYVISVVPDPERVMAEIRRVCKPGGIVVVVNHFQGANPVLRSMEHACSPASRWIGFRLDLPIDVVTSTQGLETVSVERVNLFGLWRLIVMRRPA